MMRTEKQFHLGQRQVLELPRSLRQNLPINRKLLNTWTEVSKLKLNLQLKLNRRLGPKPRLKLRQPLGGLKNPGTEQSPRSKVKLLSEEEDLRNTAEAMNQEQV